ncbi:hypothetical protein D3C87_1648280 [compost metagenome]
MLLKQGLDLLTGQRQLHQRVAERLDLRQVAKRYIAFWKIGADAARIHEGEICNAFAIFKISLAHSVGNQVAERSFIIVGIRTGNRTVCGAHWFGQLWVKLKVLVHQGHRFSIRFHSFLEG